MLWVMFTALLLSEEALVLRDDATPSKDDDSMRALLALNVEENDCNCFGSDVMLRTASDSLSSSACPPLFGSVISACASSAGIDCVMSVRNLVRSTLSWNSALMSHAISAVVNDCSRPDSY